MRQKKQTTVRVYLTRVVLRSLNNGCVEFPPNSRCFNFVSQRLYIVVIKYTMLLIQIEVTFGFFFYLIDSGVAQALQLSTLITYLSRL